MEKPGVGIEIGQKVRAERERQLYTRLELAELAGVGEQTVIKLELGYVPQPRRITVEKMASALGITVEDLLPAPKAAAPSPEERPPVLIEAAAGDGAGSAAGVLAGLDDHFAAIVEPLRRAGLGSEEIAEIVSEEVRRRVATG